MSYYDTFEEDLIRAKEIIRKGKLRDEDVYFIPSELRQEMIDRSGSIAVVDLYAAYKLLESLVQEIERRGLHA